jgi:hypothetical protein
MELVHTIVSSKDDWDRYEGLQWFATAEYARAHPEMIRTWRRWLSA